MRRFYLTLLIPVVLLLALYYPLRGAIVDDTFIHLQFARNLVRYHELSFNPHEPVYGATSPLWVLVLAVTYVFQLNPVVACRLFSILIAALSVFLLGRFVFLITADKLVSFLCALILAGEAWFVRWSSVGMETSLAVLMMILAMGTLFRSERSKIDSLINGLVMFLAVLARPELVLVFLSFVLSSLYVRRRLRWQGPVLFVLLYTGLLLFMRHHTGTFFPLTAGAKHGGISLDASLVSRAAVSVKIVAATLFFPLLFFTISLVVGITRGKPCSLFFSDAPPGIDLEGRSIFCCFAVAMILALPSAYVVMNFQLISRYLVPLVPLLIVLGLLGFRGILERLKVKWRVRKGILVLFAAAVLLQSIFFYTVVVVPATRAFAEGLDDVLVRMGVWLRDNTPGTTVVALPDIGAVGYYSERKVLDLGGLVSPEINRLRGEMDYEEILDRGLFLKFAPDYLIDRSTAGARFQGRVVAGKRFIPVLQGEISSLGIRKRGPFRYVLYRIVESGE